jgi:hypothetical protein
MKKNNTSIDGELITLPLKDLLYILLGDEMSGSPHNNLPYSVALILEHKLKDSLVYKLVWNESHEQAVIWWWNEWKNDSDRLAQLRAYSEQLRVEGWLQKANVKTISDAIKSSAKVPDDVANVMAFNILRNPNCSIIIDAMWGVRKLKTKVEEL